MNPIMKQLITGSLAALMAGTAGVAAAQVGPAREAATPGTERNREEMQNATEHINKAIRVVRQMEQSRGPGCRRAWRRRRTAGTRRQ